MGNHILGNKNSSENGQFYSRKNAVYCMGMLTLLITHINHYANMSVLYTAAVKMFNFQMKCFNIFIIFAQNIDCGYTLEPPQ